MSDQRIITRNETKKRRELFETKVYQIKVDRSSLSKNQKHHLKRVFLEAKWFYNFILSQEDLFNFDTKIKTVTVKLKDGTLEERELKYLSSQIKQEIHKRMLDAIKALRASKKKGIKIGKLKYKSFIRSIPLKQFGNTYQIKGNHTFKIQGLQSVIKCNGLDQLKDALEIGNGVLMKMGEDYFLKVTCFLAKEIPDFKEKSVGIDFGLSDNLTLSKPMNGIDTFNVKIKTSKRTKRIQRKFKKKEKYSKNWNRLKCACQKSHRKTSHQKKDLRNKIVSHLVHHFEIICIQDENIKGWQSGLFGKSVQKSCLGGIISDLKIKSRTLSLVDRFYPTTKECLSCGKKNALQLWDRVYQCDCGYQNQRDKHSSCMIEREGLKKLGVGCPDVMPVEMLSSGRVSSETLAKSKSTKQEAIAL